VSLSVDHQPEVTMMNNDCMSILDADPCVRAFELTFEMIEMLVAKTGRLRHELVGFDLRDGRPTPARAVRVDDATGFEPLMRDMLDECPVVARVFQSWAVVDGSVAADVGARREVVVISMHTRQGSAIATCRVDRRISLAGSDTLDAPLLPAITLQKGRLGPAIAFVSH
jgi:hypothetical protein